MTNVQQGDSAPMWNGFADGKILVPYCTQCANPHLPPGPVCPYCLCDMLDWRAVSGTAQLTSWVVEHKKHFAAFDPPYIIAEVQLAEGPRMPAQIDIAERPLLKAGLAGHLVLRVAGNGLTLPTFVPDHPPQA